jgi:hypothetical protein
LAAIYIKVNLSHCLSGKNISRKYLKNKNDKMTEVELWRAKVHLSTIRSQLKMSKRTLRRVLAFAKANPLNPIRSRNSVLGRLGRLYTNIVLGSMYINQNTNF